MALNLSTAVRTIVRAAGWKEARPDASGAYRFRLEKNLDLTIQSPDGVTCVLSADLGPAPDAEDREGEARLRRIGALAAGIASRRASVLSIDKSKGRLELFRRVNLSVVEASQVVDEAAGFLNDEAWWKAQLAEAATSTMSPFAFASGGFFPMEFSGPLS